MTHILYIEGSPRKTRSASTELAQAALAAWYTADPAITIDKLDVWSTELPELDGPAMEAKYAGLSGTPLTDEQEDAWVSMRALAGRFRAADALVFAVPLWNFNIPYRLKQLIDGVTHKDLLFTFDADGFGGLMRDKRALLLCARGLDYSRDGSTPSILFDFQKPYMEAWLRFIGITDIQTVVVEKTLLGAEIDREARAIAKAEAEAAARVCAHQRASR